MVISFDRVYTNYKTGAMVRMFKEPESWRQLQYMHLIWEYLGWSVHAMQQASVSAYVRDVNVITNIFMAKTTQVKHMLIGIFCIEHLQYWKGINIMQVISR